jgi:hypothetical protein
MKDDTYMDGVPCNIINAEHRLKVPHFNPRRVGWARNEVVGGWDRALIRQRRLNALCTKSIICLLHLLQRRCQI